MWHGNNCNGNDGRRKSVTMFESAKRMWSRSDSEQERHEKTSITKDRSFDGDPSKTAMAHGWLSQSPSRMGMAKLVRAKPGVINVDEISPVRETQSWRPMMRPS
jgi:hypothetical protein